MEKIKSVADAEKVLTEASVELSTAESKGDKAGKAKAMMRQANAMMRKGTSNVAIPRAQTAADIFEELKDQTGEAGALQTLAAAQGASGYFDDAAENAEKAKDLFISVKDKAGEAASLATLANAYLQISGKSSDAIDIAKSAIDIFAQLGIGEGASDALSTAVQAMLMEGQVAEAGKIIRTKIADFKNANDNAAELSAMYINVQLNIAKDDLGTALRAAKDGVKRAAELGDKQEVAKFATTAAEVSVPMSNYEDSKSFAKQAIKALQAVGVTEGVVALEQLITNVYSMQGETPPPSESREKALAILQDAALMLQAKDGYGFRDAMEKLGKTAGVTEQDVTTTMGDSLLEDPEGTQAFLLKFGGNTFIPDPNGSGKKDVEGRIYHKVYTLDFHAAIYYNFSLGGMGFGPRFQTIKAGFVHPGVKEEHRFAYNLNRIPSGSAAWEQRVGFHPGILDAGLQSGFIFAPFVPQFQNLGKEIPAQ